MAINAEKYKQHLGMELDAVVKEIRLPVAVYERILRAAVTAAEQSLVDLEQALGRNDAVAVQKIAHELKGTFGNMRVTTLAQLAADMDAAARVPAPIDELRKHAGAFTASFMGFKGCFEDVGA